MIRLQPISTSDLQHYKFMEELQLIRFHRKNTASWNNYASTLIVQATFTITSSLMMSCQLASLPIGILTVSTM